MKSVVRFAGALLLVVALHMAMTRIVPQAVRFVDVFLVLLLNQALRTTPVKGMLYGLVVGLVADAVSGGPYGLSGIAGTVTGFGAAVISQLVVIQRSTGAFALFAAGAALQQLVLVGVVQLTFPQPLMPEGLSIGVTVLTTALLGMALFQIGRGLRRRYSSWQQGRPAKIRWGR